MHITSKEREDDDRQRKVVDQVLNMDMCLAKRNGLVKETFIHPPEAFINMGGCAVLDLDC